MAKSGDLQWSGRAARYLFWRLPKGAAKYTWDSNMALASDLGRRWMTLAVYGLFLWGLRRFIVPLVPPLRSIVAVLILLWFWWAVSLVRWSWNARPGAARNRLAMREMYQTVHELRGDVREAITSAANRATGGGFTVPGMLRQHDPVRDEHEKMAREQAEQVRQWTGPDVRQGNEFEPVIAWPKFLRRGRRKDDNG